MLDFLLYTFPLSNIVLGKPKSVCPLTVNIYLPPPTQHAPFWVTFVGWLIHFFYGVIIGGLFVG